MYIDFLTYICPWCVGRVSKIPALDLVALTAHTRVRRRRPPGNGRKVLSRHSFIHTLDILAMSLVKSWFRRTIFVTSVNTHRLFYRGSGGRQRGPYGLTVDIVSVMAKRKSSTTVRSLIDVGLGHSRNRDHRWPSCVRHTMRSLFNHNISVVVVFCLYWYRFNFIRVHWTRGSCSVRAQRWFRQCKHVRHYLFDANDGRKTTKMESFIVIYSVFGSTRRVNKI